MKNLQRFLVGTFLCLALGCTSKVVSPERVDCSTFPTLEGSWRLTEYRNLTEGTVLPDPDPDGRGVVLTFTQEGNLVKLQGHTVANSVSGGYELGNACGLENGIFGGTKVAEPTPFSSQVWATMNQVESYGRSAEQLYLYYNKKSEAMLFTKL